MNKMHRSSVWFACILGLVATPPAVEAQEPRTGFAAREDRIEDLPEGPGRDETFGMCTACHGYKLVANQGMPRDKWDETLTWMTERHNMPALQGPERGLILDYLSAHHPPKAPVRDGGFKNPFTQ